MIDFQLSNRNHKYNSQCSLCHNCEYRWFPNYFCLPRHHSLEFDFIVDWVSKMKFFLIINDNINMNEVSVPMSNILYAILLEMGAKSCKGKAYSTEKWHKSNFPSIILEQIFMVASSWACFWKMNLRKGWQ